MYGPNTNLGHSSIIIMFEAQTKYIAQSIQGLDQKSLSSLDIKADVEDAYNEEIQSRLKKLAFNAVKDRYHAINIKLDKTGGLTDALLLKELARKNNKQIMVGCMVATSLAMAPAMLLTSGADFVDLDGPFLIKQDRQHGLKIIQGRIPPPSAELWGG